MRNLLALFGALTVTFLIVGYFLGWYRIQSAPSAPGHHNVNIDIDGTKIRQDLNKGGEQFRDWLNSRTKPGPDTPSDSKAQPSLQVAPSTPQAPPSSPPGTVIIRPSKEPPPPSGDQWWIFRK
jgi:hypothetical protein